MPAANTARAVDRRRLLGVGRFDLNLLKVAIAVHEAGSATDAAELLGTSQSAVSMALRRLRSALGDPLFVRGSRGLTPTPRALQLIATMGPLMSQIDDSLKLDAEFEPSSTRTTFTLAMSDVGEMVFLPRLLEHIMSTAPHATVRSVSMTPSDLERALERGDVDMAIGYFPDLHRKATMEQRLFSHHFCCLVSARHPVLRTGLTRELFLQMQHAVVHPEGRSQEIFERFLARHHIERNIVLTTPHFMSLPMTIARTQLIATVPHAIGLFFTRWNSEIKAIPPPFQVPPIIVKQHWHQRFKLDRRHRWLRAQILALFNDESDEWSR